MSEEYSREFLCGMRHPHPVLRSSAILPFMVDARMKANTEDGHSIYWLANYAFFCYAF